MKVIKSTNLPTKLPIGSTIMAALALDYWHAPQWVWGAVGLLYLILWVFAIVVIVNQEQTDIFNK